MGKSEAFPGGSHVIYGCLAVPGIQQSCTRSSRARQPACPSSNPVSRVCSSCHCVPVSSDTHREANPSGETRRLPVVSVERSQVGGTERKHGSLGEKSRLTLTLTFMSTPELSELSINWGGGLINSFLKIFGFLSPAAQRRPVSRQKLLLTLSFIHIQPSGICRYRWLWRRSADTPERRRGGCQPEKTPETSARKTRGKIGRLRPDSC